MKKSMKVALGKVRKALIVLRYRIRHHMDTHPKHRWYVRMASRYLLVGLAVAVYTVVIYRVAYSKAIGTYEGWLEDYKIEQVRLAEEEIASDPYTLQLNAEADMLAKVLYGVKDNSTDDLRTYCWCIFNRVDNSAFPNTLEDVIEQPDQWMRYHATNPILDDLYEVARAELDRWHTDAHRPVSNEFVFMQWSASSIVLRDNFYNTNNTHYWRVK